MLSDIALGLHDDPADSIRMLGEKILSRLRAWGPGGTWCRGI